MYFPEDIVRGIAQYVRKLNHILALRSTAASFARAITTEYLFDLGVNFSGRSFHYDVIWANSRLSFEYLRVPSAMAEYTRILHRISPENMLPRASFKFRIEKTLFGLAEYIQHFPDLVHDPRYLRDVIESYLADERDYMISKFNQMVELMSDDQFTELRNQIKYTCDVLKLQTGEVNKKYPFANIREIPALLGYSYEYGHNDNVVDYMIAPLWFDGTDIKSAFVRSIFNRGHRTYNDIDSLYWTIFNHSELNDYPISISMRTSNYASYTPFAREKPRVNITRDMKISPRNISEGFKFPTSSKKQKRNLKQQTRVRSRKH